MAGIKLTHVPFRGLGPAMNDLLGGHITMIFGAVSTAMGNIRAGTIRPLGHHRRDPPQGFPGPADHRRSRPTGYSAEQRYGMLAPAGTPAADRP